MLANFCKFKQMKSKAHIKQHFADNGLITLGIFFLSLLSFILNLTHPGHFGPRRMIRHTLIL